MKKIFLIFLFACAVALIAQNANAGGPALVINPAGGCGLYDGNGVLVGTDDSQIVATQSNNGNALFKCQAKGLANDTGKAVQFDYDSTGLLCGMYINDGSGGVILYLTENWHNTVSASGNSTLICEAP